MSIIGFVVLSLLAAFAAAAVTGTKRRGCLTTILVGILGWVIGGLIFAQFGERTPGMFITAFVGATVFLAVARAFGLAAKR